MFIYIFVSLSIISSMFLYKTNIPTIAKQTIIYKYNRFRKLNKLVSSQYNGICMILYQSMCILCTATRVNFLQYINNTIKKIDRKTFEVSYVINGKLYKMIIKPDKGPLPIILAYNQDNQDITDLIIPYLGPSNNFHNYKFTPNFFGMEKIIIENSDCDNLTFYKEDIIKLI